MVTSKESWHLWIGTADVLLKRVKVLCADSSWWVKRADFFTSEVVIWPERKKCGRGRMGGGTLLAMDYWARCTGWCTTNQMWCPGIAEQVSLCLSLSLSLSLCLSLSFSVSLCLCLCISLFLSLLFVCSLISFGSVEPTCFVRMSHSSLPLLKRSLMFIPVVCIKVMKLVSCKWCFYHQ